MLLIDSTPAATFLLALTLCVFMAAGCGETQAERPDPDSATDLVPAANVKLHVLNDVSHVHNFYLSWPSFIGKAYLPEERHSVGGNHGTIKDIDFSNVNVFWMPMGTRDLSYVEGDARAVKTFLTDGGGVWMYLHSIREGASLENARAFTESFGFEYGDKAEAPLKPADHELLGGIEQIDFAGEPHTLKLAQPDEWDILATDADARPVIAARQVGQGRLIAGGAFICQQADKGPDGKRLRAPNYELVRGLLAWAAAGKPLPASTPALPGRIPGRNKLDFELITIYHSDYLAPYAQRIGEIYEELRTHMGNYMGVPLAVTENKQNVYLLASGGGGWSSGPELGISVFWGGFPESETKMIELVGHELNHSWVLPHAEPLGNESIAIYAGKEMCIRMGHEDVSDARREEVEALREHEGYMKFDPAEPITHEVRQAATRRMTVRKYMVALQDLEDKYGDDSVAKYFRTKRKLVPADGYRYTAHDAAWVWSQAVNDPKVFEYFQEQGYGVERDKVTLPAAKEGDEE